MSTLRSQIIRLANEKPELRPHLLPILREAMDEMDEIEAGREWGKGIHRTIFDNKPTLGPPTGTRGNPKTPPDSNPYKNHPNSPAAGEDGSPQRKKYNDWYRKNVCPSMNGCGAPWLE